MIIARWQSKSGKWWVHLYKNAHGYSYRGVDCGGFIGALEGEDTKAIAYIESRLDTFQPDNAKTKMKRMQK